MTGGLREKVRAAGAGRCEYCQLPETASILPFEIEHIIAEKHGGETVSANLAYACRYCNSYKGPNIAGIDPTTKKIVPLFHPREQRLREHFRWSGETLVGLSASARATIAVLRINDPDFIALRESLKIEGVSFE